MSTSLTPIRGVTFVRCGIAGGAFGVALLATGIPTDLLPNPLFRRMTPPTWWDRPVWLVSSLLVGLIAATYVHAYDSHGAMGRAVGGGSLSYLAVGCPVCNKLVVRLLGLGGALQYFRPIQPLLATAGLALLLVTLALRMRRPPVCDVRRSTSNA